MTAGPRWALVAALLASTLVVGSGPAPVAAAPGLPITRVTLNPTGGNVNDWVASAALSGPGYRVAFQTTASNIVPEDGNGVSDVFVRDLVFNVNDRISVAPDGSDANGPSTAPTFGDGGDVVAFVSQSTNIVAGDTNGVGDIFVRDLREGTMARGSTSGAGAQANGPSSSPFLAGDGRYLVFRSSATNLVSGGTTGTNLFLKDLATGSTKRVTVPTSGGTFDDPAVAVGGVSHDGRYVSFVSTASTLVANDTNQVADVFVRDVVAGRTVRASLSASGAQLTRASSGGLLAADGDTVVYQTAAPVETSDGNQVDDIYSRSTATGTVTRVTAGGGGTTADGASQLGAISSHGQDVLFSSSATNLAGAATPRPTRGRHAFVWSLATRTSRRITVSHDGSPITDGADPVGLSTGGDAALIRSAAANLVAGDRNGVEDAFLVDLRAVPDAPGAPVVAAPGKVPLISWKAPSANGHPSPTSYRVYAYAGGTDEVPATSESTDGAATQMRFGYLTPGVAYRFAVAASNGSGEGPRSPYSAFVVPPWQGFDAFQTPIGRGDGALPTLFHWLTRRVPTQAEIGDAAELVLLDERGAVGLVIDLIDSTWMTTRVSPVVRLYSAYFRRLPETDGLRYWVDQAGTKALRTISASFAASAEFRRTYGSLSDDGFVRLVYRNVLQREPDEAGVRYWRDRLARGLTRGELMVGFSESEENRWGTEPTTLVVRMFFALADRAPTPSEVDRWSREPDRDLAGMLLASTALERRVT